jgi:hypothetical protein
MQSVTTVFTTALLYCPGSYQRLSRKLLIWKEILEAAIGIEPMDKGFADLCLTTWLRRPICQMKGEGCSCR